MSKHEGPLWDAMNAALDVIDLNREAMRQDAAWNADVTPVVDLARKIVEQCATIAERHAAAVMHGDGGIIAEQIATEIRELIK